MFSLKLKKCYYILRTKTYLYTRYAAISESGPHIGTLKPNSSMINQLTISDAACNLTELFITVPGSLVAYIYNCGRMMQ